MWFSVRLFVFATALLLVGGDTDAAANSSLTTTTAPTDSTTGILYSVDLVAKYTTQCSNIKTFYLEFLRGPVDQERIITVGESCVGVEDGTRWVEWWAKYIEGMIRRCVIALKK